MDHASGLSRLDTILSTRGSNLEQPQHNSEEITRGKLSMAEIEDRKTLGLYFLDSVVYTLKLLWQNAPMETYCFNNFLSVQFHFHSVRSIHNVPSKDFTRTSLLLQTNLFSY